MDLNFLDKGFLNEEASPRGHWFTEKKVNIEDTSVKNFCADNEHTQEQPESLQVWVTNRIKLLKKTLKAFGKKGFKLLKEFVRARVLKSSEYLNEAVQSWAEKNGTKWLQEIAKLWATKSSTWLEIYCRGNQ